MSAQIDDVKRVNKTVSELGEHFDTVQIFTTRHESGEEDGTIHLNVGVGNWFARYGQVHEWLVRCDEWTREPIRKEE